MKRITLALTVCMTLGIFASLAIAEHHGKKKDKADEGWTSLVPEEKLEGWAADKNADYWTLEDGVIVGENPGKKESNLWTEKEFGDYELIVVYKNVSPGDHYDSGVYTRGKSHQVQIGISGSLRVDLTGCIYCPVDKNGKYPQMPKDKVKEAHKLGEWNKLHIVTQGKNIKTYLNGELINDYDAVKYPEKGKIGLQLHGGVHMKMQFKTVKIKAIESD
ncbi:MAG: DUF1080 domain-containing protein [Phycisphaeraceae bacterium]